MLKIHEFSLADGALCAVTLTRSGGELCLDAGEGPLPLPPGALRAVMSRYGAPFDAEASCEPQGQLELEGGASLTHVRHLAGYDVIARDYLVYAEPGVAALCAMATGVAGALGHLALAARRLSEASGEQR